MILDLIEEEITVFSNDEAFLCYKPSSKTHSLSALSLPPPKPISQKGYNASNYLGPKELSEAFSTGSSN